jgi:hypothetical protein
VSTELNTVNGHDAPLDYALRYAAAGISVLPIKRDGTKQPLEGRCWKYLQERIAAPHEIRRMFVEQLGVGGICGRVSGNLETLDIDDPELVEPFEAAVRGAAPGLLERLPTVATPRGNLGGRHYRYRVMTEVRGSTKLAQSEPRPKYNKDGTPDIDPKTGKQRHAPETLIETRGEGGYALLPGSPVECHELKLPYEHISGPQLTEIQTITEEEHAVLWRIGSTFNRFVSEAEVVKVPSHQGTGESPGDDYNRRASWDEILLPAGWTIVGTRGGITSWRRPGKSIGVSGTTGVKSSAGNELFCCFSTNAYPFEGPTGGRCCSSYSKFAAFAVLNHQGDFSAAAKELRAKGFGSSSKPGRQTSREIRLPDSYRPFPTQVLPSLCSEFVRQAAASIGCDESMIALPLLTAIAAAIGNACRIELKPGYSEPAVIWAAVVSESGSRKSPALECPIRPLRKKEGEAIKQFRGAMRDYEIDMRNFRAATKKAKKSQTDSATPPDEPALPVCRRYTVSDVTSEAVAVRLEQNPRGLLLIRDELAGFFSCMNQYKSGGKGGDEAAYLAMHGARFLTIDRKNSEKPQIYVPLAALSIVGAVQPGVLQRILTRARMESGMAARFLLAYPPPKTVHWTEKTIDKTIEDRLETMFDWLVDLELKFDEQTGEPSPALLPLAPDAKPLWIAFHDEHAAEQTELQGDLSAAWAKLTGYAARLSLICELATWATGDDFQPPTSVSAASVKAGIALARWFSTETKRIYAILDETDEQREVRELVDYIRQQGGTVTARQLTRGPRRYRNHGDLAEADLQRLAAQNLGEWVHLASGDQGGRPTIAFRFSQPSGGDETSANPAGNGGFVAVATDSASANSNGGGA